MIGALLHPHTVVVERVTFGPPDDDGVPTQTTSEQRWGPCSVQQATTTETDGSTEFVTDRWRVSGPLADWIRPGDRVRWNGSWFEVNGEPAHFTGGALDHTEVAITRWEG